MATGTNEGVVWQLRRAVDRAAEAERPLAQLAAVQVKKGTNPKRARDRFLETKAYHNEKMRTQEMN